MEERTVIITDIKTGLATISGYHPDNYSTQLLISGVNKNVDKLISDHKAVVETLRQELKQNQIEYGEMQKNLHFTENENKMLQNKIDELEKMNIKFYNCLESTYKYDLPKIDDLCDIAGVHKFTMLRNELEELLAKGIK